MPTPCCVLTSATHGIEGYCGSGAQVGLLHDEEFVRAVSAARVAVLFVHAVNPHGFFLRPPRQRGQRRSQPEFPRLRGAAARQRGVCRTCIRILLSGDLAAADGERAKRSARTSRSMASARVPGGASRAASTRFPSGLFFGGCARDVEQPDAALGAAAARVRPQARGVDRLSHGARTARARRKIYAGRNVPPELARAARGGATT